MAKKRGKRQKNNDLALIILGFIIFFVLLNTAPHLIGFIMLLIPLAVIYLIYKKFQRFQILKKSDINTIDSMSGIEFEHYLKVLFQSFGYKAIVTKASGDFGADLILKKDSKKIAVQAKRYTNNVGVSAIQEIVGAKNMYKVDEIWVATNSYFTTPAKELAHVNNVNLIDRDKIIQLSYRANKESSA